MGCPGQVYALLTWALPAVLPLPKDTVKGPDLCRGFLSPVAEWIPRHKLTYPGPLPPMESDGRTDGDDRVSHSPSPGPLQRGVLTSAPGRDEWGRALERN